MELENNHLKLFFDSTYKVFSIIIGSNKQYVAHYTRFSMHISDARSGLQYVKLFLDGILIFECKSDSEAISYGKDSLFDVVQSISEHVFGTPLDDNIIYDLFPPEE